MQRKIREADTIIQETGRELMGSAEQLMVTRLVQKNIVSTIGTLNLCIPGELAFGLSWLPTSISAQQPFYRPYYIAIYLREFWGMVVWVVWLLGGRRREGEE